MGERRIIVGSVVIMGFLFGLLTVWQTRDSSSECEEAFRNQGAKIYRCETEEAICYLRDGYGLSCKWK